MDMRVFGIVSCTHGIRYTFHVQTHQQVHCKSSGAFPWSQKGSLLNKLMRLYIPLKKRRALHVYNYCLGRRKCDSGASGEAVFNFDNCIAWLVRCVLANRLSLTGWALRAGGLDLASSEVWVEPESVEGTLASGIAICGSS